MAKKDEEMQDQQPIDPMVVMLRLTEALEKMTERQQTSPDASMGKMMETLSTALARVSESQLEGSKLIASETRRAHRPSNEVVPQVSVFNRRGKMLSDYQKPVLKCTMMVPWLLDNDSITREEVELANLLQPGDYVLKRTDNSKVTVSVSVTLKQDGVTPSRLLLTHETAFNNDNFRLVPTFSDMLRQVLKQHGSEIRAQADAVLTDEEEEALIEAGELSVSV